jgi:hypothetical protein
MLFILILKRIITLYHGWVIFFFFFFSFDKKKRITNKIIEKKNKKKVSYQITHQTDFSTKKIFFFVIIDWRWGCFWLANFDLWHSKVSILLLCYLRIDIIAFISFSFSTNHRLRMIKIHLLSVTEVITTSLCIYEKKKNYAYIWLLFKKKSKSQLVFGYVTFCKAIESKLMYRL